MTDGSIIMNYDVSELSNKPEKKKERKTDRSSYEGNVYYKKNLWKGENDENCDIRDKSIILLKMANN